MGKGQVTRERIVGRALEIASLRGLEGVTIGELAKELELSKSGVFAHFRSKEELQLQVLEEGVAQFKAMVARPGLAAPRGEPRLRALFERWLEWGGGGGLPGGCIVTSAASELDDRPGPLRDFIADALEQWLSALERVTQGAVDAGHFRATLDVKQFVFEAYGAYLAFHFVQRTLREPAKARARAAFDRMLEEARA